MYVRCFDSSERKNFTLTNKILLPLPDNVGGSFIKIFIFEETVLQDILD